MQTIKDKPGYLIRYQYEQEQRLEKERRDKFCGYTKPVIDMSNITYVYEKGIMPQYTFEELQDIISAVKSETDESNDSYHTMTMKFDAKPNSFLDLFRKKYSPEPSEEESDEEEEEVEEPLPKVEEPLPKRKESLKRGFTNNNKPRCYMSELQAVPYMQTCELLGGARKKKILVTTRRERPVRRKPIKREFTMSDARKRMQAPPSRITDLTYNDDNTTIQSASSFRIVTYQTSAYDPANTILTTAYSGFKEESYFYDQNRIHKTLLKWSVSNNEPSSPVRVGVVCTTYDANANILSYQNAIDLMEGPHALGPYTLSRATGGQNTKTIEMMINPAKILGDNIYWTDEAYVGYFNTSPNDMMYYNLVVLSESASTPLTNGVIGNLSLTSWIKFFRRRLVLDPAPLKEKEPVIRKDKNLDSDSDELVVISTKKKKNTKIQV